MSRTGTSTAVVLCLLSLGTAPALAGPGASLGGDDPGCAPDSKDHRKCSDGAYKAFVKAYRAVIKCHVKQADATFKGSPADDEPCETGPTGKSAKEKLDSALGKIGPLCAGTSVLATRYSTVQTWPGAAFSGTVREASFVGRTCVEPTRRPATYAVTTCGER